jgi:hypothetical protein
VSPRKLLIAGNWKMNHGPAAAGAFFGELGTLAGQSPARARLAERELCIAPAAVSLPAAVVAAHELGGQAELARREKVVAVVDLVGRREDDERPHARARRKTAKRKKPKARLTMRTCLAL